MDILLTWSGNASHDIATRFRTWLPTVLPGVEPWISDEDIAKGRNWFHELTKQLDKSHISITFITSENVRSPWVYYEVGFIAAKLEGGIVCPYLVDVEHAQVRDTPLGQLQGTLATKQDTWRLIRDISRRLGLPGLNEQILEGNFNSQWPKLKTLIEKVVESLDNIDDSEVDAIEPSIEEQLSQEGRQLLLEAAHDPSNEIMYHNDSGGTNIHTNGKLMIDESSPRTIANWKAALNELSDVGLIVDASGSGTVFEVTKLGYEVADRINSRS